MLDILVDMKKPLIQTITRLPWSDLIYWEDCSHACTARLYSNHSKTEQERNDFFIVVSVEIHI